MFGRISNHNQEENMMANCQLCPISHECQEAKTYMKLIYHEEFYNCVLVRHLNAEMDTYISIGLGDPRGYNHNAPHIHAQGLSAPEVIMKHPQTDNRQMP